eukprot:jgi/Psemu1/223284/e_gw1.1316.17.1
MPPVTPDLDWNRGVDGDGDSEHNDSDSVSFPLESASKKKIDNLLSREMMKLSVSDRNAIHEEMHGVRSMAVIETPELIDSSLDEFKREFNAIKTRADHVEIHGLVGESTTGTAIPTTTQSSTVGGGCSQSHSHSQHRPRYTETNSFRLVFLRCELFDARRAALRYLRYLDLVCELFGADLALDRPLSIAKDFSKAELKVFRKGHHQLLPFRDRAGRRVVACLADVGFAIDPLIRTKIAMYLFSKAAEDVNTQRNGATFMIFPAASTMGSEGDNFNSDERREAIKSNLNLPLCSKLLDGMPLRMAAFHLCFPDTQWFRMVGGLSLMLGLKSASKRTRLKIHVGEPTELRYEVIGYGIPGDMIPITETGSIKTKHLKEWIRLRTIMDDAEQEADCWSGAKSSTDGTTSSSSSVLDSRSLVDCPSCKDVLFRSGKSAVIHQGNMMFRDMVGSRSKEHTECSRTGKKNIVKELIEAVQDDGGRFLVWDRNGWWKKLSDAEIRVKVGTFIRNYRSTQRAKENLKVNESGTYIFTNHGIRNKRKRSGDDTNCSTTTTFSGSSCCESCEEGLMGPFCNVRTTVPFIGFN